MSECVSRGVYILASEVREEDGSVSSILEGRVCTGTITRNDGATGISLLVYFWKNVKKWSV